jgi:hypothetical protein
LREHAATPPGLTSTRRRVRHIVQQVKRFLSALAVVVVALGLLASGAQAAIRITRSELNNGQLRVEGSGALPNHSISVNPGAVSGTSDGAGAFKIQSSPYSSSTCQVTVSDGATSASASLSGCSPTTPPPPPGPAPGPAVTLTPTSLTFGPQDIGTTSAAQSITVTNSGNAGLFINSAAVPNTLDYTEVNDGCSGLTLAAGTSCSVSITFSPTVAGTRTAAFTLTDNAAGSPHTAPLTGTTPAGAPSPPLAIDTRFFTCTGGVCDIGAGSNVFVNNFFSTGFLASGGAPPYTWSGTLPAALALRSSGLVFGSPSATGSPTFPVTVTDSARAHATGTFTLNVTGPPPASPPGCQAGSVLHESLSGPSFNGRTPSGQAAADETKFTACGGFSILTVSVSNVNLPDGAVLWVTLDFKAVGTITIRGRSGTMKAYNMGRFGVSRDAVRVYSALPDVSGSQQILIGGFFS